MYDPQINIEDIECPTLRGQIKTFFEEMVQLCPSDSTIRATVRHLPNRFLAEIRVASESVVMQATEQASALSEALEHLQTKLLSQIVDWRNHRFAS